MSPSSRRGGESVLLVVVNTQKTDLTLALLKNLSGLKGMDKVKVLVVDNQSTPRTRAELRRGFRLHPRLRTRLVASPENLGYFGAFRRGVRAEKGRQYRWTIISNDDIAIPDRDFFVRLQSYDPGFAGVLGPDILSEETGVHQNPFREARFSPRQMLFYRAMHASFSVARALAWVSRRLHGLKGRTGAGGRPAPAPSGPRRVYAVHGAFMIFGRDYFDKGGIIDANYFMYGEENTVSEAAHRLSVDVVFDPRLKVIHQEHGTLGKAFTRKTFDRQKEAFRYFSKHYFFSGLDTESFKKQLGRLA